MRSQDYVHGLEIRPFKDHETKVTSPWARLYLPLSSAGFSKAYDLVCFTGQPLIFLTNLP